MRKRTGLAWLAALLSALIGPQAVAQDVEPQVLDTIVSITGTVSNYDRPLGVLTVGEVTIFVGDVDANLALALSVGDEIDVVGTRLASSDFIWAIAVSVLGGNVAKNAASAELKSITGTGKQSITGTGRKSITGTGKQSVTGTGVSVQSITGTGVSAESITGTGTSLQSITGTGRLSITGTGR